MKHPSPVTIDREGLLAIVETSERKSIRGLLVLKKSKVNQVGQEKIWRILSDLES